MPGVRLYIQWKESMEAFSLLYNKYREQSELGQARAY